MTKPTIRIHDILTEEIIDREMTDAEYTTWLEQKALDDAKAELRAKADADKLMAQSKLLALGLTETDLIAMGLMPKPVEPAQWNT